MQTTIPPPPHRRCYLAFIVSLIICFSLEATAFNSPRHARSAGRMVPVPMSPYHRNSGPFRSQPTGTNPLFLKSNHDDNTEGKGEESEGLLSRFLVVEEPRLLILDLVTILLVCQLLGLADCLNDPGFWANGGFDQPIGGLPTTLDTLVQRDAAISMAWVLASLKNGGYRLASVMDESAAIKYVLNTFTDYCSLRIVGSLALAFALHVPVDGYELLRQVWFTLLVLGSFRYLYAQNNIVY